MEDFELFDRWNKIIRWIFFIPILFITYFLMLIIGRIALWYALGYAGLEEDSFVSIIIREFIINFSFLFISLSTSVACAPKGKIIISSCYLGVIIFLLGFGTFSNITYYEVIDTPTWSTILSYSLTLLAGLTSLIMVIINENQKKRIVREEESLET